MKKIRIKEKAVSFYKDLPIKKKLLAVFGTVVILQAVSGLVFNVVFVKKSFTDMYTNYSNSMLCNIGDTVKLHMNSVENISQNILYNERIYSILYSNTNKSDRLKAYDETLEIDGLLKNISYPQNEVEEIYLYNQNGLCYSMNGYEQSDMTEVLNMFRSESPRPAWKNIGGKIYMGRTIYNKNTSEKLGVQIIRIKDGIFAGEPTNLNEFMSMEIITDDYEFMYSYRDASLPQISKDIFDNIISGRSGSFVDKKYKCMVFFLNIDEYNWNLVAMMPLAKLHSGINNIRNALLLLGIITCLMTIILAVVFSKDLLKIIHELIDAIKNFEEKNSIDTVPTERKDEMGFLTVKYNDLVKHINMLVNSVYKEQISRKNAQIKSLQAQLNPHFIYNTLEIMNWKAQFHGADDVSDMIYHLSGLIDAGMGKKGCFVALREELEYIDHYCSITKIRFGKNIEFRFDISEEAMEGVVPLLLLQPIVENAVIHGTSKVGRKGIILIRSYVKDEILYIEVTDNGIGIEKKSLEELTASLNQKIGQFEYGYGEKKNNSGIGLFNANERIKLNYGDEYGITVFSRYRHYCMALSKLPFRRNMEENTVGEVGGEFDV